MVEKGTRKVIFYIVEKRSKDVLLSFIKESVRAVSQIKSDCWGAYATFQAEGYLHWTVNHSVEFNASDETCTNMEPCEIKNEISERNTS